jgi:hypothetical protein
MIIAAQFPRLYKHKFPIHCLQYPEKNDMVKEFFSVLDVQKHCVDKQSVKEIFNILKKDVDTIQSHHSCISNCDFNIIRNQLICAEKDLGLTESRSQDERSRSPDDFMEYQRGFYDGAKFVEKRIVAEKKHDK